MPVGVPKVPYQGPEEDEASWVDLYNRLYRQRFLFLGQELNSEIANQIAGLMVFLSLEDKSQDLYLFINSPGGLIINGMLIFDIMRFVEAEVQTVCVGIAASMASLILANGEITKRLAFPNARVMIHQPASSLSEGPAGECLLDGTEIQIMRDDIAKIYVQITGKPFWQIHEDMDRDVFMSPEEAQAHGIVDMIGDLS
nr:clp protease proteolytic subunit [Medicago coronata]